MIASYNRIRMELFFKNQALFNVYVYDLYIINKWRTCSPWLIH